jgi:hypothetical protein
VHPMPSHLAFELCQARRVEVERRHHRPAGLTRRPRRPRSRSLRRSTGWLLIDLGVRLAATKSPLGALR